MDVRRAGRRIEVLIVEDSPTQAEKLKFMLESRGFRVFAASNGREALSYLTMGKPDLVISDIMMPEMDGYELCRKIRTLPDLADTPVILVTSLSDPTDVIKGLEAGADSFIPKPYDEEYLVSRIEYLVENKKLRRESKGEEETDVFFAGRHYHIAAERLQILDLLLSTYENAYRQNRELSAAQRLTTDLNRQLEETVQECNDEITIRKATGKALHRQNALLAGINRIFGEAMSSETEEDLARACLSVAEEVTESAFGFLGEIGKDGLLHDVAISDPGWTACAMTDPAGHRRSPGSFNVHGIYGRVLLDGKGFFTNDPASHPDTIGVPFGHPPLTAFMGVPLVSNGRPAGLIAMGNREGGYGAEELEALEALAPAIMEAFSRKRAEEALKKANDELEKRVGERTLELQHAYDRLMEEGKERDRLETQLRQAQKMEALGTLSGGIAHDFNNILAAIIGFSELIKDRLPQGSREIHHVTRVMEASMRGRDLVRQMLAFSRKAEQQKKPLRLRSVVEETVGLIRATIPTTIGIRVDVASDVKMVLADPVQIQQILMNLCTNAAHAMRESGGILAIHLRDHLASPVNGDPRDMKAGFYAKLTVSDTGAGMSPSIVEKIFDPFFTTKALGEGTGLGLSVVHGIVKQHDGYITVRSEPGKGSLFTVYLPQIESEPETAIADDDKTPTGSERILFVDDEEALAEMAEDILGELGYHVTSRTSSTEALALFKRDPSLFDLVITDQTMPDVTGIDLAKELLAIRDIPVIMCTGFSDLVNADRAKAAGIKAFVMKPLTKREIAKTVRKVLDE